jgi:hypothetical protein
MTTRQVTVLGFVCFAVAGLLIEWRARSDRSRLAPMGDVMSWLARSTPGRVAILLIWWWTGWHFFAR